MKSGVSDATVARAELYGQDVRLSTWDAWAEALEVPVSDLVSEEAA